MTVMFLKCFKLFYIKDNSVENSIDFIKKEKKKDSPLRLLLWVIVCDLHVSLWGGKKEKKTIVLPNFIEKKWNDLKDAKYR